MIEEINKQLEKCPETPFDRFDLKIDLRKSGAALREELVKFSDIYGRITQLAANALLMYKKAKNRFETIEAMAWDKISESNAKVSEKKKIVKNIPVIFEGKDTTINEEEGNLIIYEYLKKRGESKVNEISDLMDMARSMLSWDKNEISSHMN